MGSGERDQVRDQASAGVVDASFWQEVGLAKQAVVAPLQKQVGGDHYKKSGIQAIEYIHANDMNFMEGSAIKYIARHRRKGGKEDLLKAIHYLEMLIELEYGPSAAPGAQRGTK